MRETTQSYSLTAPVLPARPYERGEVIEAFAGDGAMQMHLSAADAERFADALVNPPPPPPELTSLMRRNVFAMQDAMLARPDLQITIEPRHFFAHGLYGREVTLPAGSTAVGHSHAQEHICIISKGRVQVVCEDGVREISAPATMIIPPGRKNCVHALEETVWTTIHASDAQTPEEAEATLITPEARPCLS